MTTLFSQAVPLAVMLGNASQCSICRCGIPAGLQLVRISDNTPVCELCGQEVCPTTTATIRKMHELDAKRKKAMPV